MEGTYWINLCDFLCLFVAKGDESMKIIAASLMMLQRVVGECAGDAGGGKFE